ncbi:hypothetical protein F4604DRAFT_1203363 [Suillus subluteus]|nr:hypothetical protein F4604DRAFT_1203363 [Suillus subluteus]
MPQGDGDLATTGKISIMAHFCSTNLHASHTLILSDHRWRSNFLDKTALLGAHLDPHEQLMKMAMAASRRGTIQRLSELMVTDSIYRLALGRRRLYLPHIYPKALTMATPQDHWTCVHSVLIIGSEYSISFVMDWRIECGCYYEYGEQTIRIMRSTIILVAGRAYFLVTHGYYLADATTKRSTSHSALLSKCWASFGAPVMLVNTHWRSHTPRRSNLNSLAIVVQRGRGAYQVTKPGSAWWT